MIETASDFAAFWALHGVDMKKTCYWERIRFDGSLQNNTYVVMDGGKLVISTTSIEMARSAYKKALGGKHVGEQLEEAAAGGSTPEL